MCSPKRVTGNNFILHKALTAMSEHTDTDILFTTQPGQHQLNQSAKVGLNCFLH